MADLLARGSAEEHCWRRTLTPHHPISLGRSARSDWQVPWDKQISRLHATLIWQDGKLLVRRDPAARNEIFVRGTASDEFFVGIGEQFVIGTTTFTVQGTETEVLAALPTAVSELTCSHQELLQVKYTDADQRIEVLAALPGIIRYSPSDAELESRVVDALLGGIPQADAAAVVWLNPATPVGNPEIKIRCGKRTPGNGATQLTSELRPSRRLIVDAIRNRRQSVMYSTPANLGGSDFTVRPGVDWAMCAPLPDDPEPGWALYVEGQSESSENHEAAAPMRQERHKSDLKFAELVADIFGAIRQVRDLQSRQSTLARFLSQRVRSVLAETDIVEALRPRETEITVLFCDLRGSCLLAEEAENELILSCARVNEALSIMSTNIIDKDGVIGDFQGDAAMGFWGWPAGAEDQIELAARAALAIRRDMARAAQKPGHPLAGFTCGLGIAHGTAVAGQVGTLDQFKIGVFGPVVNLAARLESLTKLFHVPILVDEPVAQRLTSSRNSHWTRCRQLARIQPYGMRKSFLVSELLPSAVEPGAMAERDRRDYEAALSAFLASRWEDASRLLERLPPDAGIVLKQFMDRHGKAPPGDWNGVIALETK